MTVRASNPSAQAAALERAIAPAASEVAPSHFGVVVGGTPNGDVIVLSSQALAIVKAGRFVRAMVMGGLELLRRTIAVDAGCAVLLQYGIYRTI